MLPKTWQWILGMLYVIAVAVIWIVASFVVQSVVSAGVSPFLIAYICNSLFIVYIPIVELGAVVNVWFGRIRFKHFNAVTLPSGSSETMKISETENLLEDGAKSEQVCQAIVVSKDEVSHAVPNVGGEDTSLINGVSATVEADFAQKSSKMWTRKKTAFASAIVCPFWFLAQFTFNLSLSYTTVTSNTILSSTSSLFTFFLSLKFLREKFAWVKLWSVLLCMAGTVIVSLSDSKESASAAKNHAWGDVLCIVSAGFYAVYTTLIKKQLPDEAEGKEEASTALFFGYLGLFNGLFFLPVMLVLHFTGVELLHRLSALQYSLIIGKGMLDNVLSDYLWAKAVLLTSTTAATAGLTIQGVYASWLGFLASMKLLQAVVALQKKWRIKLGIHSGLCGIASSLWRGMKEI
ncbi:hypothetical protein GOP47_0014634 [Adiantum capillus-veneris]|uniref:EamA domain-containing protein n=1 Tax=Adiantum capillus-veneris TaxID=13818 RepID=A0A9D4UML9_ADICA|nr:hypothetical protein GOP47_0014634 [Adiantum capillus-veneris]